MLSVALPSRGVLELPAEAAVKHNNVNIRLPKRRDISVYSSGGTTDFDLQAGYSQFAAHANGTVSGH